MSPTLHDDHLPESFFTALYPSWAAGTEDSSSELARLVEHFPGAVWVFDTRLQCRATNAEARQWLASAGPAQAVRSMGLHEWFDESVWTALLPFLASALQGGRYRTEAQLQHPAQGPRWFEVRAEADHDPARPGALPVRGVFLHLHDITEQRQTRLAAEAAQARNRALQDEVAQRAAELSESELRFRLMTESLRDTAIFFLDPHGHVAQWTPSAQTLLGHEGHELLGQHLQVLYPADAVLDATDAATALERAALLGQSESVGWRLHRDGRRFWAQTVLTALFDPESGESRGFSCLLRDMTEVKRLEDLLRQLNQELEARVAERTQQLQAINQDLEAFTYSVSHDLRAPLRHMASFAELLRETLGPEAPPEALRHLGTIAASAQHMGQLIEGLLAFSRLGRAPLARREVAMAALLQSSVNRVLHDPALQRPAPELQWHLPAQLPAVPGDPMLLSQVWDNLLSNALKYSRPVQPARVEVGAWTGQTAAGERVFWVRDNGVGFDPRRADRLFGVFQRLHRTSEFEGTGIGLALCRRIIERHGGRIWAESEPGVHTTFYFSLPA
ncbi:MAG: ATP-binding protein [Serpentinimonas sp.]|nr:ATP-binding protein [Serpentinimonas sp.]